MLFGTRLESSLIATFFLMILCTRFSEESNFNEILNKIKKFVDNNFFDKACFNHVTYVVRNTDNGEQVIGSLTH
jgi:hypothetical protein